MNEIKYEKVGRRDINLFSINYKIFQDICQGNKPVAHNYPPSRILSNRRHTICCACNHIWLTEEDYNSFWSEFDQAWKSDQFDYIYVDISDLQDGVIMVAKFVDKKSDYCVLREWAVAGTVGPDSRLREKKLREKLRTVLSEQKLVAWVAFFLAVALAIGGVKVHNMFLCLAALFAYISGLSFRKSRRTQKDLKEI